jgi:two-component system chemotaxis response regulator CheB
VVVERKKIKVLIGGKSGYARLVMRDILNAEPGIEVVDTVRDGEELLDKAMQYHPDVIVLDVDLPRNPRFLSVKRILQNQPISLIFSGTQERLEKLEALRSIERTAYELLVEPDSVLQRDLRSVAEELVQKVKRMAGIHIKNAWLAGDDNDEISVSKKAGNTPTHLIVIGASTGGSQAVEYVVRELPRDFPGAVLIAQHMPFSFTSTFTRRLSAVCSLAVEEGTTGMSVERGQIIIAPGHSHMTVFRRLGNPTPYIESHPAEYPEHDMPSVNYLMESAARLYKKNTVGVLLSGLGRDGVDGLKHIKKLGGTTIAQDEFTSAVFGMPKAAIDEGYVKMILPLSDIPKRLMLETRTTKKDRF